MNYTSAHALLIAGAGIIDPTTQTVLKGHDNTLLKFKSWLVLKQKFDSVTFVSSTYPNATTESKLPLQTFFEKMSSSNTLGVLCYVGHGIPETWQTGGVLGNITKSQIQKLIIDKLHPKSLLLVLLDSCFSDSMLYTPIVNTPRQVIFLSSARDHAEGNNNSDSAWFDSNGGFFSNELIDYLIKQKDISTLSYQEMMLNLYRNYNVENYSNNMDLTNIQRNALTKRRYLPLLYVSVKGLEHTIAFYKNKK